MIIYKKTQIKTLSSSPLLPIIFYCGQSNQEGGWVDEVVPAPYTNLMSNVLTFYKTTNTSVDNGVIQPYRYGVNNNWRTSSLTTHGASISSAYRYSTEVGKPFGIVNYCLGGSRLVDDGVTVSTPGLWDVNGNASRAGTFGLHYPIAVNYFLIPAFQKFTAMGYTPYLAAIHWVQGEADSTILYCANNYEVKLNQLFNQIMSDLLPYDPMANKAHIIITRIHNNFNPPRAYQETVRTALVNVANSYGSRGHWINSDSYPVISDFTHWSQAGQITHGNDLGEILKTIF